jgi:LPXTG-site transpeptidase (sortase) family protein
MKRLLRAALTLVIVAGIVTALWPVGQSAYGLWSQRTLQSAWRTSAGEQEKRDSPQKAQIISARNASHVPGAQRVSKHSDHHRVSKAGTSKQKTSRGASKVARISRHRRFTGWPPTRLIIPDIDLDVIVVQGIDNKDLRRGPGHDPNSGFPGEWGNCVIAGHRNVYGSFFYRLGELGSNSIIQLCTPDQTFTYKVATTFVTASIDTSVLQAPLNKQAPPRLTLYTCTLPKTTNRIVVVANLVDDVDDKAKLTGSRGHSTPS